MLRVIHVLHFYGLLVELIPVNLLRVHLLEFFAKVLPLVSEVLLLIAGLRVALNLIILFLAFPALSVVTGR